MISYRANTGEVPAPPPQITIPTFRVTFEGYSLHRFRPEQAFPRSLDITVASIQRIVANYYNLSLHEFLSARRARYVARPRQVAMYLCRQFTKRSLPEIGRRFGNRDHTTVIWALKAIEKLKVEDEDIAKDLALLSRRIAA